MKRILTIIIVGLSFIQCSNFPKDNKMNEMEEIDTLNLNRQLLNLTESYIMEYPQFNNYVIYTNFIANEDVDRLRITENLFIIAPANKDIFSKKWFTLNHFPSHYFITNGKKNFLKTEIDALFKPGFYRKNYVQSSDKNIKSYKSWTFSVDGAGSLELLSKDAVDFIKIPTVAEHVRASYKY